MSHKCGVQKVITVFKTGPLSFHVISVFELCGLGVLPGESICITQDDKLADRISFFWVAVETWKIIRTLTLFKKKVKHSSSQRAQVDKSHERRSGRRNPL